MPKSYDSLISALETVEALKLTMKNGQRESSRMSNTSTAFKIRCYACDKVGHKKSECTENKNKINQDSIIENRFDKLSKKNMLVC